MPACFSRFDEMGSIDHSTARKQHPTIAGEASMLTVVTHSFPPRVSASAILMTNILSAYSGNLSVLSGHIHRQTFDPTFVPPCPTRYLIPPQMFPRIYGALRKRHPAVASYFMVRVIQQSLRQLGTKLVLATYPFDELLVAAFRAAQKLGLPFYAYMHDLWEENTAQGSRRRRFAEQWEPIILTKSTRILCVTETMQWHYEKKYGVSTELLQHSIPDRDFLSAPTELQHPKMAKPTVLFSGGVSRQFNLDALRVLTAASELLPPDYDLILATHFTADKLTQLGLNSTRLQVKHVSRSDLRRFQSKAHVLIAPLSHKNCTQDEVKVLFSTKLLTYLLSGRPIIVFAPADSYHAESAKKNGWGYVVTEDSPTALASAIITVVQDSNLSAQLVENAFREARSRHAKYQAQHLHHWVEIDSEIPIQCN